MYFWKGFIIKLFLYDHFVIAFYHRIEFILHYLQAYGGNSFLVKLYRTYFEARTSLGDMWRGNPVLTTVLFGLPLGFFSLILYSICCADILDADEEEEGNHIIRFICVLHNSLLDFFTELKHEKKE